MREKPRPGAAIRAGIASDLVKVEGSRDDVASSALPPTDSAASTFDGDLRTLRRRVLRSRAIAIAARCALGALAVALVPAALAAAGAIAWAWAVVVPFVFFVTALGVGLSRPPSAARVARLLDDRLGLFDVTATALQFERSGEPVDEGPAAPVFAEAAALLHAGARRWRVRPRLGFRELGAGAGLALALAVLVVIGGARSGGATGGEEAVVTAPGHAHRKQSGNEVSPPLAPPRANRKGGQGPPGDQEERSPLGLYDFGYEGRRPLPRVESGRAPGLYSHRDASSGPKQPSTFAGQSPGESSEAREKAEEEAATESAEGGSTGERKPSGSAPESLKSLTGGKAPPSGSVSPLPSPGSTAGSAGKSSVPTAPAAGGGSGARAAAGGGRGGGGASGGGSAGSQRASLGGHGEGAGEGRTGGALSLRAGFAAARGGKAATARGPRDAQGGGGPGRSAGIGGSAFEEGSAGALGYVPPDSGVAPGLDGGLFDRYLNALGRIGELSW